MTITHNELRNINRKSPTESIQKIAKKLNIEEQSVRKFFNAEKPPRDSLSGWYKQPDLNRENLVMLEVAKQMIRESKKLIHETHLKVNESRELLR